MKDWEILEHLGVFTWLDWFNQGEYLKFTKVFIIILIILNYFIFLVFINFTIWILSIVYPKKSYNYDFLFNSFFWSMGLYLLVCLFLLLSLLFYLIILTN